MKISKILSSISKTPILRNLLITSLVVSVIFPLYSVFFIVPSFNKQLTKNTEDEAIRTASYLENIIIKKKADFTKIFLPTEILNEIEKVKSAFQLEKVKVFSKQGEIIFSTSPKDIGEKNKNDYFYNIVAKGNIYTKVVNKDAKTSEGRVVTTDVVETYVPIFFDDTFNGAFEIYYDITNRKKDLNHLLTLIYLVLFSISSILMVSVVFILFKASKNIHARELAEVALRKAHDELENKVSERTSDLKISNEELLNEIEERRRMQSYLQESEEKFRNICETAQDAIIMMDEKGEITYWNKAAEKIFQYENNEVMHKDLHTLIAPQKYYEPFDKGFEKFLKTGEGQAIGKTLELIAKRKSGKEFPIELSLSSLKIKGTWNAIGIVKDITERIKADNEKRKLESQIRHTQKLESIGTLAGGIAHDFNNILSSILGYTELALDDVKKGSKLEDKLQQVYTAGKRARDLVKQILAFARQSEEKIKPIQIGPIIKEVLKFIRSSIPTTIKIQESIESNSIIEGNPTEVHQILMNLCTNSSYAMEDKGGILKVSLIDVLIERDYHLKNLNLKPGKYLRIEVSDTGLGIAPENIEYIFEPYFTTKGPGEGTGMGLALAHGIVESYGGKITVDSTLGMGTTFSIYLPVTRERPEQRPYATEEVPLGTERILFVDDEASIAKMNSQVLERLGYKVTTRTSSVEALELFRSKPNNFDIVITDMTMPNMTGEQLAAELMKIQPDIPVILCTGYSKKISNGSAEQIGIKAFANKPIVKSEMAKIVRKVLDESNGKTQP